MNFNVLLVRFFFDGSLDYDMDAKDRVQVYVSSDGSNVRNVVCRIETAWRYGA